MKTEISRDFILFTLALITGFFLRIFISTLGHNYDLESYQIVSELVLQGKNVYANTERYNYGPIWFFILGIIKSIQIHLGFSNIQSLHLLVTSFLSFIDLLIAILLANQFGVLTGLVFYLSPVSILITGYHSQFDNFAILIAFLSWIILQNKHIKDSNKKILLSAFLMGISLIIKHVLIFFPIWILFFKKIGDFKQKLIFVVISYSLFIFSFLPFISVPGALNGIQKNVLGYSSFYGNGFFPLLANFIVPFKFLDNFLAFIPIFSGFKFIFFVAMIGTGVVIAKFQDKYLFYYYLIALLVWTPSVADQYLVIPVLSCAIFRKNILSWMYLFIASLLLFGSGNNLGALTQFSGLYNWLVQNGFYYYNAQVWLFIFLGLTIFKFYQLTLTESKRSLESFSN